MESHCFVLGNRITFTFMIERSHVNVIIQIIVTLILKLEDQQQLKM